MQKTLKALALTGISFFLLSGFGAKHSSVEAKSAAQGKALTFTFTVKPDADMKITREGPWSVTLTDTKGLKLDLKDGKFTTKELNEAIPGFEVKTEAEPGVKSGKVNYTVKAFVCSADKKHCYPQEHKGTLDWTQS